MGERGGAGRQGPKDSKTLPFVKLGKAPEYDYGGEEALGLCSGAWFLVYMFKRIVLLDQKATKVGEN